MLRPVPGSGRALAQFTRSRIQRLFSSGLRIFVFGLEPLSLYQLFPIRAWRLRFGLILKRLAPRKAAEQTELARARTNPQVLLRALGLCVQDSACDLLFDVYAEALRLGGTPTSALTSSGPASEISRLRFHSQG